MSFLIGRHGSGGDPYFADVLLLMGFEGSNGSSSFVDESSYARTISNTATPTITTTSPIIGTSSMQIDSGDGITAPNSADFSFAGEFTIEMFLRPSARAAFRAFDIIYNGGGTSGENSWRLRWQTGASAGNGGLEFIMSTNGSGLSTVSSSTAGDLSVSTTSFLTVERNSSNLVRIYKDGTSVGSGTVSGTLWTPATGPLWIGAGPSVDNISGQYDEVRITDGVARYNGNFTPPTTAFPRS